MVIGEVASLEALGEDRRVTDRTEHAAGVVARILERGIL
jgi:hypothetical protein